MEDNSIQAFDSVFMTVKARDREVIVDENGLINYTKLMESITGDRRSFAGVCRKNGCLYAHVLHHDKAKLEAWAEQELRLSSKLSTPEQSELKKTKKTLVTTKDVAKEIDKFLSSIKTIEIDALIEANILITYSGSGNTNVRRCSGTYGPLYLLDFLLFNVDVFIYQFMKMSDLQTLRNEFWNIQGEMSIVERINDKWIRLDRPIVNKGRALAIRAHRANDLGLYFRDIYHGCAIDDSGLWFRVNVDSFRQSDNMLSESEPREQATSPNKSTDRRVDNFEDEHIYTREEISELCVQRLLEIYKQVLELHKQTSDIDELAVIESEIIDMKSCLRWFNLLDE